MKTDELKRALDETSEAVENYLAVVRQRPTAFVADPALRQAAQRLAEGLYVLLPPRGPASTVDCPHCGNPVKVTLSK